MKISLQLLSVQNSYILTYILQQKSVKANLNIALRYYMIEKMLKTINYSEPLRAGKARVTWNVRGVVWNSYAKKNGGKLCVT